MDFDDILNQWNVGVARKRKKQGLESPNSEFNNWLDQYPPGTGHVAEKEIHHKPQYRKKNHKVQKHHPQDSLNLHGYSCEEAEEELNNFMISMRKRNLRTGLIIHGKGLHSSGKPVLAPLVRQYLASSSVVVKFGRALNKHGGSGATWFVLDYRSR